VAASRRGGVAGSTVAGRSVVDVEAGEQGDVGAARADNVMRCAAGTAATASAVAVTDETEREDGYGEQVRVFAPAMIAMTVALVRTPPSAHS